MNDVPHGAQAKCLVVGDIKTGKTSLVYRMNGWAYPDQYLPRVADQNTMRYVSHSQLSFTIIDSWAAEDNENLRGLAYRDITTLIITFGADSEKSRLNIETHWLPELKKYLPYWDKVPILLVATKCDLRDDLVSNLTFSDAAASLTMAEQLRVDGDFFIRGYYETAAVNYLGIEELCEVVVASSQEFLSQSQKDFDASKTIKSKIHRALFSASSSSSSSTKNIVRDYSTHLHSLSDPNFASVEEIPTPRAFLPTPKQNPNTAPPLSSILSVHDMAPIVAEPVAVAETSKSGEQETEQETREDDVDSVKDKS